MFVTYLPRYISNGLFLYLTYSAYEEVKQLENTQMPHGEISTVFWPCMKVPWKKVKNVSDMLARETELPTMIKSVSSLYCTLTNAIVGLMASSKYQLIIEADWGSELCVLEFANSRHPGRMNYFLL